MRHGQTCKPVHGNLIAPKPLGRSGGNVAYSKRTLDEATDISSRLRALFRQDERDDPICQRVRAEMLEKIKEQLRGDESLIEAIRSKTASRQIESKREFLCAF